MWCGKTVQMAQSIIEPHQSNKIFKHDYQHRYTTAINIARLIARNAPTLSLYIKNIMELTLTITL